VFKNMLAFTGIFASILLIAPAADAAPQRINTCGTISQPGSYVLSRNINGTAAAGDCILINASHVTLNLNGFSIGGPGLQGVAAGGDGIKVDGTQVGVDPINVSVRNGSVIGFVHGVYFDLFTEGGVVENIRAIDNEVDGVFMGGEASVVRDSVAFGNGNDGFDITNSGAIVTGNVGYNNVRYGIAATCDSVVIGNTGKNNQLNGDLNVTNQGVNCALVDNAPPF
jgi:hypothetical protein